MSNYPGLETMTVQEYVKNYTSGARVTCKEIWAEVKEYAAEVVKWNQAGMEEEWGDVVHFTQLWAYWRFGLNQKLWPASYGSVKKFMDRLAVWRELYAFVGLDRNISNFCGNCQKEEKVIKQLAKFGIAPEQASAAFNTVVRKA